MSEKSCYMQEYCRVAGKTEVIATLNSHLISSQFSHALLSYFFNNFPIVIVFLLRVKLPDFLSVISLLEFSI